MAKIASRGRDAFVAEVVAEKRDDYAPDLSRKSEEGDKDGVIYAIFVWSTRKYMSDKQTILMLV